MTKRLAATIFVPASGWAWIETANAPAEVAALFAAGACVITFAAVSLIWVDFADQLRLAEDNEHLRQQVDKQREQFRRWRRHERGETDQQTGASGLPAGVDPASRGQGAASAGAAPDIRSRVEANPVPALPPAPLVVHDPPWIDVGFFPPPPVAQIAIVRLPLTERFPVEAA